MDFSFTEEQQLLEDTVRRFVAKDFSFGQRRAILASAAGWSREAWQQLAELGLLAESHGINRIWVQNYSAARDCFLSLVPLALASKRIGIGS